MPSAPKSKDFPSFRFSTKAAWHKTIPGMLRALIVNSKGCSASKRSRPILPMPAEASLPDPGPRRRQPPWVTTAPSSNMGIYMATTRVPTMMPSTTMMIGSMSVDMRATVSVTSPS